MFRRSHNTGKVSRLRSWVKCRFIEIASRMQNAKQSTAKVPHRTFVYCEKRFSSKRVYRIFTKLFFEFWRGRVIWNILNQKKFLWVIIRYLCNNEIGFESTFECIEKVERFRCICAKGLPEYRADKTEEWKLLSRLQVESILDGAWSRTWPAATCGSCVQRVGSTTTTTKPTYEQKLQFQVTHNCPWALKTFTKASAFWMLAFGGKLCRRRGHLS